MNENEMVEVVNCEEGNIVGTIFGIIKTGLQIIGTVGGCLFIGQTVATGVKMVKAKSEEKAAEVPSNTNSNDPSKNNGGKKEK